MYQHIANVINGGTMVQHCLLCEGEAILRAQLVRCGGQHDEVISDWLDRACLRLNEELEEGPREPALGAANTPLEVTPCDS